ncbi:hypothetical protein I9189_007760 [Acinetobacter bereziniae]|uniref:hypothetical protein n=1 Tax=Acinetobacter bereziniae TaxID=106648 RepID=UPI0019056994|nr:hypothetical protein [Acinetobacter bereziniae]QQC81943.1 hypothetical protein I9192_07730 [Acinetobacter bereziniae]UUN95065.1 hypothetical protein I9189_007760 [Acinetobacter bereziniae]
MIFNLVKNIKLTSKVAKQLSIQNTIDFSFRITPAPSQNLILPFGIAAPKTIHDKNLSALKIYKRYSTSPITSKNYKFSKTIDHYQSINNPIDFSFRNDQQGEDTTIFVAGFQSEVIGNQYIKNNLTPVSVLGFNTSGYGKPAVKNYLTRVNLSGFSASAFGNTYLVNFNKEIKTIGFNGQLFGTNEVKLGKRVIYISGFNTSLYGLQNVWNFNKELKISGFNSQLFGTPSKVYNLKQFVSLNSGGINSAVYGTPYLQGGVKYIYQNGFDTSRYGVATVINTKADQYLNLSSKGIVAPIIPNPDVSPRYLRPSSIKVDRYGSPSVFLKTRYLMLNGSVLSLYGTAWISHSPRYLYPHNIESYESGYPKIFDPTQKVAVTGVNTVIAGGVFGDISIRNTRRIIKVFGLYAQSFSDWGVVESTRRVIEVKGFDSKNFGITNIYNKTPSIVPIGINSFTGLNAVIGYRIRTLKPSGWYQPKLGNHTLTKTPELKPSGLNESIFGSTWISNKTRSIYAGLGRESLAIGESKIWHYSRTIRTSGLEFSQYGTASIDHGRRTILAKGASHAAYGNNSWVSYAVRSLSPSSIIYPNIPNHRVGSTQKINVFGYVATLFGSRIIPESQFIYTQGFLNTFGISAIDLWKKYIKPNGFLTTGQEGGHRFGTHKFWNLRQYIEMYYDVDSGLTPPKWSGWTAVVNKNKVIGAIGTNVAKVAEPSINNNARLIIPVGINSTKFSQHMISARVRYLRLQGIEQPYISGWSNIYNSAYLIAPKGINTQYFGTSNIINTRRYFNRIGNFESLEFGKPMIADRIRTLKFEQRYTIAPPYIPIHKIYLHTRYIEEVGRFDDYQAFGNPSLSIHWNRITTRWAHRDYFGDPRLFNVTPELNTRGRNSEEFGQASIRTQWRELLQQGSENVLWGKSEIAFRDRQFSVSGFTQWAIPTHKVTKTGVPPYFPQYIWLDAVEIDGKENGGHGIPIPVGQVTRPSLKTNVIFTDGFIATKYGEDIHIQSNGILVDYGISMPLFEQGPLVTLKNRTISVEKGIDSTITVGTPRFTPHTIYAVVEAPTQAKHNHPSAGLHYVNSDGGYRTPGEVFGQIRVTLKHRVLQNLGLGNLSGYGTHQIQLKRRYIDVKGLQSYRMGWHSVGDGTQKIIQFSSSIMTLFGRPTLQRNEQLHRTIRPSGFNSLGISSVNWISHFHRTLKASGLFSQQMGTQKSGDTPFMWQGLRIGELIKGNYGGFANESFGKAWISLKVRDLKVQGFESFRMEYDYTQFDKRMRVTQEQIPLPTIIITAIGFDALNNGVPNIRPAVHYIRPDGNADQFRKGAF